MYLTKNKLTKENLQNITEVDFKGLPFIATKAVFELIRTPLHGGGNMWGGEGTDVVFLVKEGEFIPIGLIECTYNIARGANGNTSSVATYTPFENNHHFADGFTVSVKGVILADDAAGGILRAVKCQMTDEAKRCIAYTEV